MKTKLVQWKSDNGNVYQRQPDMSPVSKMNIGDGIGCDASGAPIGIITSVEILSKHQRRLKWQNIRPNLYGAQGEYQGSDGVGDVHWIPLWASIIDEVPA